MKFEEVLPKFKAGEKIRQINSETAYIPYKYYVIFEGLILKVTENGATTVFDDLGWNDIMVDDWIVLE